jgi:hypothetical protein
MRMEMGLRLFDPERYYSACKHFRVGAEESEHRDRLSADAVVSNPPTLRVIRRQEAQLDLAQGLGRIDWDRCVGHAGVSLVREQD